MDPVNPDNTPTLPGDQAEPMIPSEPVIETPTEQPVSLRQILDIAGIVYLIGAAGFLVWSLASYFIYTRKILHSAKAADDRTQKIFSTICKKYGMKKQPALLVASGIHSPAAFGIFRRRIVLPDIAFSENGLVGTLAHEVTHCKRGDLYMKLVELIACSLNWFNPLVHIAAFKCEMEMELSCDEKVLSGSSEAARAAYADVMLDIIRRCRRNRGALTTHFNPKKSAVTARFKNILYGSGKRRGRILIGVCLVLCVLAGAFVACQTGDDLPDDIDYAEGIYIKDIAGADMVLIDGTSPCTFWSADGVVIEGLTDGDRIRIGVREFLDSSPMQAEVYSIEKLSDGTIDDIDPAVLDSLRELGWIDADNGINEDNKDLPDDSGQIPDGPKHSYTSDIDNFIPPEANSLPKITVLTTGKVLLTYETEEKLPLVYFGQGVDAETMQVTKTEFEAPDFSYTDFEVIDYLYESGYNMYATVRFTLTDGTQNDVLYSGYMGEYTFKEDYEYEYKWRNIRTESANEINRARGQYDPAQQAALIPNQSAQVLFWLRTQSRCYYFCSIRTLNSAANAYTDDPPKDFAIYYQQYDQNFFSVIDEPIPEEYPYDSIVPVLAITGEECISMRCILQLSDGERTYYISYQAYEGIDQAYHPVSDDEVKALANMYPEIFGVIEENIKWTQYTETRTGEDGKNYQISFVLPVEWMHDSGGILNDVNRNKRIGSRYIAVNRSKEDFVSSLEEMAEQYHVDLDSPLTGTSDSGISYMGYCFEGECEIPGDITGRYLYRFAYSDSISLQMDVWKRNAYDDDSFYEQYVLPIVQSVTVREAGGQTDQILNTEELSTYSLIPSGTAGCIVSLTLPSTWKWDGSHFNEANVRIGVYSDQKRVSLYGALPTLQEFEATLRESTGRVYQMDSPITGKTDTGYSFTGYYGDEEMPKGEMSRRYMFYITADQGVYTLEIWQRLDFDGANFLAETVLPIVQSFAIQQTLPHQAILEDRFALYDTLSKKEMLLSDWLKNNEYAVSQYTVIDLDHDADLETVLWLTRGSDANAGFLILHSNAGKTNAHLLYYRQFADLKEDGTFSFSSGVSNHGFGEIRFTGEACSISRIAYCESEDNTTVFYYSERDSRSLTKAEYESWERAQSNKSDPVWYAWNANEEHSAQPIDFSSIGGDWYHSFNYEGWYAFYGLNFRSQTAEMQFDHGLYESEYAHRYSGTYTVDPATQEITAVLHDGRYIHNDPDITIKFTIKVQTEQNNQTLILHILACDVPRYQHLVGQSLAFTREFGYAELEYQAAQNYYQMWYDKELTIDVLLDKSAVKKDIAKEVREATGMDLLVPSLTWEYTADEDRFPLRFFITDNGGKKMVETNIIRYKDEKDGMEKYAVEVNPTVISVE